MPVRVVFCAFVSGYYDAYCALKGSATHSIDPFSIRQAKCVEDTKITTLNLTPTLIFIGFYTLIVVRITNPKYEYSPLSSLDISAREKPCLGLGLLQQKMLVQNTPHNSNPKQDFTHHSIL